MCHSLLTNKRFVSCCLTFMMLNTFIILKFLLKILTIEKVTKTNYDFMNFGTFLTHEI